MHAQFDVLVNRHDLQCLQHRTAPPGAEPGNGEVLLAVDRFALTANNLTYAMRGESAGFWQYFPAQPPWGRLPVWGFADVVASRHDGIAVGERVFGFLPMSTQLVVRPGRVTPRGFVDTAPHRAALFPLYNHYARWAPHTPADPHRDDLHAVVRPLFFTSFVLDDHLADRAFFGARTLLLSSASSKTALGTAWLLRDRSSVTVCGLTSARHRSFAAATGCFHQVHTYDDVARLDLNPPIAFIDFAGAAPLRHALHQRFGSSLVHALDVGATHRAAPAQPGAAPSMRMQTFSGPDRISQRRADWGAQGLQARYGAAEARFLAAAARWLTIVQRLGPAQLEQAYRQVLEGRTDPAVAFIVRMAMADAADTAPPTPAEERAALSLLRPQPGPGNR